MYRIIIEYKGPPYLIQGVKEELAMCCEKYGDCRVVSVEEGHQSFYQTSIQGMRGGRHGNQ